MTTRIFNLQFSEFTQKYKFSIALENVFKNYLLNGRSFTPLMLGIKAGKSVNDSLNQQVLKCFSDILTDSIREQDQVFRCPDNEFVVVLNEGSSVTVQSIIQRIDKSISDSPLLIKYNISCKLGHEHYQMQKNFNQLFDCAKDKVVQKNTNYTLRPVNSSATQRRNIS